MMNVMISVADDDDDGDVGANGDCDDDHEGNW